MIVHLPPSLGKSGFVMQQIKNRLETGKSVVFLSCEMDLKRLFWDREASIAHTQKKMLDETTQQSIQLPQQRRL